MAPSGPGCRPGGYKPCGGAGLAPDSPYPLMERFELTIPVADWGAEHDYDHHLMVCVGGTPQPAVAGAAVPESVVVVDDAGNNHPELTNVIAVVDPGISAGKFRLRPGDGSAFYREHGITAVSYKVRMFVQIGQSALGLMDQPPDPVPLSEPTWAFACHGPVPEDWHIPTFEQIAPNGTSNFTTSTAFVPGSLRLWMNGLYQGVSGTHFTESPTSDGFTFNDWVPEIPGLGPGDRMYVMYWTKTPTPQVQSFPGAGSASFTTSQAYAPGSLRVWLNGYYLGNAGVNFSEGPGASDFSIVGFTPGPGDEVSVMYWLPADPAEYQPVVEDLSSVVPPPGPTQHFDTSQEFEPGSLRVYANGQDQGPAGFVFVEDGDHRGFTISGLFLDPGVDILTVLYWPAQDAGAPPYVPIAEDLSGQCDGMNTHFVTSVPFYSDSIRVFVRRFGGLVINRREYQGVNGETYIEDVGGTGITYPLPGSGVLPLNAGDILSVFYWKR